MKRIRQGNDINIFWEVREIGGSPYPLEGKDLAVYVESARGRSIIDEFDVSGNTVSFTFFGKDQKSLGPHSIVLVENAGKKGMHTVDVCEAFAIVPCLHHSDIGEGDGLVESLRFESELQYLVPIDSSLSATSRHPVENNVVTAALEEILSCLISVDFNEDFAKDFTICLL